MTAISSGLKFSLNHSHGTAHPRTGGAGAIVENVQPFPRPIPHSVKF